MSLFDRFSPRTRRGWRGLEPPPLSLRAIVDDLRWHDALYRHDGLPRADRLAFLALRVAQRVAYNAGWHAGRAG